MVTLNLTITNSNSGTDVQTTCDPYTWIDGNTYTSSNNTATHTLTNAVGCDSVVTLNLTINTVNNSITQASNVLTASASGATYQWVSCPTMIGITGATSQSYTATSNGDYAVILTENGCTDTSACATVNTVGIFENNSDLIMNVFPNPTNGKFTVDLGDSFEQVTATITDLTGRVIQQIEFANRQLLDLEIEGSSGIYFLTIETGNQQAIIKVVKNN